MRYELTETLEEILGVDIPERGVNASLLCPFHDEDTPSFSIRLDDGRWQCFGCGVKGGIEKLARLLGNGLDETTRQDILIRGLDKEPAPRSNFAPLANRFIDEGASGRGHEAIERYLAARGLPGSVRDVFGIGYDLSRNCITLPYWDDGAVTGIKLRADDGFKYSHDGSQYGLYNVEDLRGKPVVVLGEGESDTHQLWFRLGAGRGRHGGAESPAVGVGGTSGALKSERLWQLFALDLLFARKVYICYDADEAGDDAFKVAARSLGNKAIRVRPPLEGDDVTKHFQRGGTLDELGLADEVLVL